MTDDQFEQAQEEFKDLRTEVREALAEDYRTDRTVRGGASEAAATDR